MPLWLLCLTLVFSVQGLVHAHDISIDEIDWKTLDKKMKKLSPLGFHPFLMPLIMDNRDAIGLTDDQLQDFKDWRNKNRVQVMAAMNKILKFPELHSSSYNCFILRTFTLERLFSFKQIYV